MRGDVGVGERAMRWHREPPVERGIGIEVEEISGSSYQAPYISTYVFATKFIVLIPPEIRLLPLREEFLDFCDQLNIDAILEPIKR